jgi:predicted AAA+ superfamily ATPase
MKIIKRKLFQEIKDHLQSKEISLIIGSRQVGKTTLMRSLEQYLKTKNKKTVFFSLDYETDKKFFNSQQELINKLQLQFDQEKGFVFIDEIQRKENAGIFLKGIYDLNLPYKFIVSGSGSLELKEKIHESLAGRKRLFELNPVTFFEFIDFKTFYQYENRLQDFLKIEKDKALIFLDSYLNFGGYPKIILEEKLTEKIKIINEIYNSYIEKDIVNLLNLERKDSFDILLKLLASQIGSILNFSNLSRNTNLSLPTLKKYLWYAEKTFVINFVTPYFTNLKKEIIKAPIIYFNDLGLRNFLLGLFGNLNIPREKSFLFQNLIFNLLREKLKWSGRKIHFWRTIDKAEVDFVIDKGREIIPIEVKYSFLVKPEIKRSLKSFIEKYNPPEAWVVNLNFEKSILINKTKIKFIPFFKLL